MGLKVSELFTNTIQGEGKRRGYPSAFIRLGGCNMSCKGFGTPYEAKGIEKLGCDTWYSVDTVFSNDWKSYSDAKELIYDLGVKDGVDVVITGGEPLIHWNNPIFQDVLKILIKNNHYVTIETNGSIEIEIKKEYQKNIVFSISPKLTSSGESHKKRINKKALEILLSNENSYFKFVVSLENQKQDLDDILEVKNSLNQVSDVYIMPLTVENDFKEYQKNSEVCVNLCFDHGWIYSNRDHFTIWGDKKGV